MPHTPNKTSPLAHLKSVQLNFSTGQTIDMEASELSCLPGYRISAVHCSLSHCLFVHKAGSGFLSRSLNPGCVCVPWLTESTSPAFCYFPHAQYYAVFHIPSIMLSYTSPVFCSLQHAQYYAVFHVPSILLSSTVQYYDVFHMPIIVLSSRAPAPGHMP